MSGNNQPISIGTEDPEYYAELLTKVPRLANRRLLSDERSYPIFPGIHDGPALAQRLQTLLNVVADISLCQPRNVSATMACLKPDKGALKTQLYVVFNHEDDEASRSCRQHLESIFEMLRQVPYRPPAMDGSPKVIATELETNLIEICRAIHNHSFDIFAHRVTKHKHRLSEIRGYVAQERTGSAPQHPTFLVFLQHLDMIIETVAKAQATRDLSTNRIQLILSIYWYWTQHNILPKDALADNRFTLLDDVDRWLVDEYDVHFQLRRWAVKIMSFVISANRLFVLTQSRRLRNLLDGNFSVQVLSSPATTPYRCDLSSETIQMALDTALAGTGYLSADGDRKSFVELFQEASEVVHWKPTVHAELALIIAMAKGEINYVEPYIGVSKPPCIMCSHYIRAFNNVTNQEVATRSSHGKAYPGWFWPSLPSHDGELRPAFLGLIRQQLLSDFGNHTKTSDSSVGSGFPELNLHTTRAKILDLFNAG